MNEAGEQLEDFCLEHKMALANTMFEQHPRQMYTWTSSDGNTRNQIDYMSIVQRWKTSLMNFRTCPAADCDTDHQLLVATVKVRLARRQRQHGNQKTTSATAGSIRETASCPVHELSSL